MEEIKTFLEGWKPFAELPPGSATRRAILRFVATEDRAQRREILAKANGLFQLHATYEALGILRRNSNAKAETFSRLIELPLKELAAAIKASQAKDHLALLQEGFEFGRVVTPGTHLAARQFLGFLWALQRGGTGLKYSIYPNGVLFSSGGKTHDEMVKDFTNLGFGSGQPSGGGTILRDGDLAFSYDTYSKAVRAAGDVRGQVAEALRRWIRATGGEEEKVTLTYHDNVATS